jgi:hypothetical protein
MEIYILDANYDKIALIDEAESVLWQPKFNDLGESEIYISCSVEMLSILKKGHYLYRYDDEMFCKIEDVEIETDVENGDYIIATAKDMSNILSGRIVRNKITFSGTVANFLKTVLMDNVINPSVSARKIDNFVFDMTSAEMSKFTETIETTVASEDVLRLIIATCKAYNYGFRTSFDTDTYELKFKLYKGVNRALDDTDNYVEFSPEFGNINSSRYKTSDANCKNVVYIGYVGDDEQEHLLSMFNGNKEPSGEERREIYVDGTSTSRDITLEELAQIFPNVSVSGNECIATVNGVQKVVAVVTDDKYTVTDETYLLLIRAIGYKALAERVSAEEFSGEVDVKETYQYKVDYNLGDIVKVINEYGIEANAQVVEVMESEDNDNGHVIEPRFQYIN